MTTDGKPQPIVEILDVAPDEPEREPDPDWDELTARVEAMTYPSGETTLEIAERVLGRMDL